MNSVRGVEGGKKLALYSATLLVHLTFVMAPGKLKPAPGILQFPMHKTAVAFVKFGVTEYIEDPFRKYRSVVLDLHQAWCVHLFV